MKTLYSALIAVAVFSLAATADILIFDDSFHNGWYEYYGNHLTNGFDHGGTGVSLYNADTVQLRNDTGTDSDDNYRLSAYIFCATDATYPDHRLHRVDIEVSDPATPDTLTRIEYKASNSDVFVDGIQDTEGYIDFPDDGAWHEITIDLTSHDAFSYTPAKVGDIQFVVAGWQGDAVFLYVDDVALQSDTPTNPVLSVSPLTLDFGGSATSLTYSIENSGSDTLFWTNTISLGASWMSVSTPNGTQDASIVVLTDRASLGYGSFTGRIDVTANGDNPAEAINVFITKSPPNLAVSPLSLDYGVTDSSRSVDVWNDGEGTVAWSAAPANAWITVSPTSGVADIAHELISIVIDRGMLAPSQTYSSSVTFTPETGDDEIVNLSVSTYPPGQGKPGFLRVAITSEDAPGTPMPGRLILHNDDSNSYIQSFHYDGGTEETNRWGWQGWPLNKMLEGIHHPGEYRTYKLPPGTYSITAGRGMSWEPRTISSAVHSFGTTDVSIALSRIIDTEARGWYCGEAHFHVIHGGGSYPISDITSNQFMLWGESAGMNWMSVNQEYMAAGETNLAGQQAYYLPMSNATFQCWMGGERPKSILGHLAEIVPSQNPYTVLDDPPYYIGCEQIRQQGGVSYPVHSDRQFGATPFKYNNFYKTYPLDALLGPSFDAWSIASISEKGYNGRQIGWWYALLNRGARLAAMADSDYGFDTMFGGMGMLGNWLTYVNITGKTFSIHTICEGIREGRTFATTGPLLFFSIDDAQPGDTLPLGSHTARIEAHLSFQPWSLGRTKLNDSSGDPVEIEFVELVRNGELVFKWDDLNVASTTLFYTINESDTNAYYTAHVKGTDGNLLAAVASPIYFDDRPHMQEPMTTIIKGRAYDAFTGEPRPAVVRVSRYNAHLADFSTTTGGFFTLEMPLDADVRVLPFFDDVCQGPLPYHRVMDHEPVFGMCTEMDRAHLGSDAINYSANKNVAANTIQQMVDIVATMSWEFPLKYQFRNSYVATNLSAPLSFSSLNIMDFPAPSGTYENAVCAMLLVDAYEVAPGDTINYAAIYCAQGNPSLDVSGKLYVKMRAWRPYAPSSFNVWGATVYEKNDGYIDLGDGYYAYLDSITVPAYATNCYQGPGIWLDMYTRDGGAYNSNLGLFINVGSTKRGLLVTSMSEGIPIAWPNHLQRGLGPANLTQRSDSWQTPYNDYRALQVQVNNTFTVCPNSDMAMCADTDDAFFHDWLSYYAEDQTRRDPVRPQPGIAFPATPIVKVDPFAPDFGTAPPVVSLAAPANGTHVVFGDTVSLACAYTIEKYAVSNVEFIVTSPAGIVKTNNAQHEFITTYSDTTVSGIYTWVAHVIDETGNSATSPQGTFHVLPEPTTIALGLAAFSCMFRYFILM